MYWDTVRSSSDMMRKDVPCGVVGRGVREVTDEVDTGMGEDDSLIFPEARSTCRIVADVEATTRWIDSAVEESRMASEVGEAVLGGRGMEAERLAKSEEMMWREVAETRKRPCSPAAEAVAGEGKSNRRWTPREGEKEKSWPLVVVTMTTSSTSASDFFLRFLP